MKGGQNTGQYRVTSRRLRRLLLDTRKSGFTIIEVLIVLAVTALIFVTAATQISGRQDRTAFQVAIREVQSQIQKTINEATVGQYPNFSNVACSASPTGPIMTTASGASQGVNKDCVLMGKAIQFKVSGTDPEQFRIYTIAGLRATAGGAEVTTLSEAWPKAVAPTGATPNVPDNSVPETLQSGLTTYSLTWGTGNTPTGVIAFGTSLGSYSGGTLVSGSSRIQAAGVNGTTLGMTRDQAVTAINTSYASSTQNPTGGIKICFASGTTEESGLITIGNNGSEVNVKLELKSNTTCA